MMKGYMLTSSCISHLTCLVKSLMRMVCKTLYADWLLAWSVIAPEMYVMAGLSLMGGRDEVLVQLINYFLLIQYYIVKKQIS